MMEARQLATALLAELFRYRRVDPEAGAYCPPDDLSCCVAVHLSKVTPKVRAGEPVDLILPGFPAKSPSPRKVLGPAPDFAEEHSLRYLQGICDRLAEIYPPGVRLVICSDGRVFSDVVGVDDEGVTAYRRQLERMIVGLGLRSISVFSLDDVYVGSYEAMRRQLCAEHAQPLPAVRERVLSDADERRLYNGLHRFLTEDLAGAQPDWTRSQVRAHCRSRAYQLIQQSNAWSRLLERRFSGALRLSIHPRHPHHDKIGILLADETDPWTTPWHSVALVDTSDSGRCRLVHRHEAERLGGRLVFRAGRPSHFELDNQTDQPSVCPDPAARRVAETGAVTDQLRAGDRRRAAVTG